MAPVRITAGIACCNTMIAGYCILEERDSDPKDWAKLMKKAFGLESKKVRLHLPYTQFLVARDRFLEAKLRVRCAEADWTARILLIHMSEATYPPPFFSTEGSGLRALPSSSHLQKLMPCP